MVLNTNKIHLKTIALISFSKVLKEFAIFFNVLKNLKCCNIETKKKVTSFFNIKMYLNKEKVAF